MSIVFRNNCTQRNISQDKISARRTTKFCEFFLKPTRIYLCWLFYGEMNRSTVCHNCSQFEQKVK